MESSPQKGSEESKKSIVLHGKEIKVPENMPKVYAIGAAGGFTPYDFRILFFDAGRQFPEGRVEVALSPLAAKELRDWLDGLVKEFEKSVRKIESKKSSFSSAGGKRQSSGGDKSEKQQASGGLRMFG